MPSTASMVSRSNIVYLIGFNSNYLQPSMLVMREVSRPMFLALMSHSNSSPKPSKRQASRARSKLPSTLLPPNFTRRVNMISTSRTPTLTLASGSPAWNSLISIWATSRSTPLSRLRIPSTKMTGRLGHISPSKAVSKSLEMI